MDILTKFYTKLLISIHKEYSWTFNNATPTKWLVAKSQTNNSGYINCRSDIAYDYIRGYGINYIAKKYGITRERTRQILWKAVRLDLNENN